MKLDQPEGEPDQRIGWGSDIASLRGCFVAIRAAESLLLGGLGAGWRYDREQGGY